MRAASVVAAIALFGCTQTPELALDIRLPADESGLRSVSSVNLTARRGTTVLAQRSFSASTRTVSLGSVAHGSDTVISLDGIDSYGNLIAHGNTCAIDFESGGIAAPLYFAPINFFAPTVNAPAERQYPIVVALPSGPVLVTGGFDGNAIVAGSELFTPGAGVFAASTLSLLTPRWHAESVTLPSIGALVVGGLDASGNTIGTSDLFVESQGTFQALTTDARVEHRAVLSAASTSTDARVLITGGSDHLGGAPSATTFAIRVLSDGSYRIDAGPSLIHARRSHAAVAYGTGNLAIVFGGYADTMGTPLDSVEIVDFDKLTSTEIGHLTYARADATATLTPTGVLVAGGIGSDGKPLDAELFDILQRTTRIELMVTPRHGHSATLVGADVLIAGGIDASGNATAKSELFTDEFLTNRELGSARANHVAVPLCDDTVLVIGGESGGAELYSEPAL